MMVPAWDTRTGEKLPNDVPKHWLDNKIFPYLIGRAPRASDLKAEMVAEPADTPAATGRETTTTTKNES